MHSNGVICCGVLLLYATCCASLIADQPETLSEGRLRLAQNISNDLQPAPEARSALKIRPLRKIDYEVQNHADSRETDSRAGLSRRVLTPKPQAQSAVTPTPARAIRPAAKVKPMLPGHSGDPVSSQRPQWNSDPRPPLAESSSMAARAVRQVADESLVIPIESEPIHDDVQLVGEPGLVTLIATGAELSSVLRMIADHHGLNLVLGPDVGGPVTVSIRGARLEEVLDAILGVAGFAWNRVDNLLYVTGVSSPGMDRRVQGRRLQVYPLDYVSAADVQSAAAGLLSPVGNSFISESDSADQLKTRELLVIEDVESAHRRVVEYISQVDVPPRQVLVEAHVLQIALDEDERHGINLKTLARTGRSKITLEGSGFADTSGGPSVALRLDGTDMQGLLELIRKETNSRTLASPKLSVVNRQEAKIQIGQRLPYSVATTTQTATVQSVEFLEVGIVLTVQPVITADGHVLMTVLPKVSGGKITENGFPEEDTTEVQTTVLLPDGGGVILGGLIREESVQSRALVPGLGRVPILGHLFKKSANESRRNELVVALVTHVMEDACAPRTHELIELEQTLPDYSATELRQHPVSMTLDH